MNETLKYYIEEKRKKLKTDDDIKKFELVEKYFSKPDIFFKVEMDIILGMFFFLEIPKDVAFKLYNELTSIENYRKVIPKQRFITGS